MAGPKSGLWRLAERDDDFGVPYWAHLWGGGLALSRYVIDHPALAAGRRVLDLGAGSGIVGIAAALAGAAHVIAADTDPYAMVAMALNAEANGVRLVPAGDDLTVAPVPDVDLILVGDLFYDEGVAARVTAFLDRCLAVGKEILIGDPSRAYLPTRRLTQLAAYPGPDFAKLAAHPGGENAVFRFQVMER